MKVIKPIVTVTVYLKESDLFVSMISMELPRTHLEEFAVFTRLSRESISHKSIRSVEGSRPLFKDFGGLHTEHLTHFLFELTKSLGSPFLYFLICLQLNLPKYRLFSTTFVISIYYEAWVMISTNFEDILWKRTVEDCFVNAESFIFNIFGNFSQEFSLITEWVYVKIIYQ